MAVSGFIDKTGDDLDIPPEIISQFVRQAPQPYQSILQDIVVRKSPWIEKLLDAFADFRAWLPGPWGFHPRPFSCYECKIPLLKVDLVYRGYHKHQCKIPRNLKVFKTEGYYYCPCCHYIHRLFSIDDD